MIVFFDEKGLRDSMGYKEFAEIYLEHYGFFKEEEFVVNVILLLDTWENEKGLKFERIMPTHWNSLFKAVRVLSVDNSLFR